MAKQVGKRQFDEPRLEPLPNNKAERSKALAAAVANPATAHGIIGHAMLTGLAGGDLNAGEVALELNARMADVRQSKLDSVSDTLVAQAFTLDAAFIEMSRLAMLNIGQYPEAAERFMRLALKAQAQSRATLEALAKLHQPREQTVRHVHVDNRGGQAVIAEAVNTGGLQNGQSAGQAHATGTVGDSATLLGADPLG